MADITRQHLVACMSLDAVIAFIRSVAYATAMEAVSHVEWKPYRESTVLNVIYTIMPWKGGPGIVKLIQNQQRLEDRTDQWTRKYIGIFWKKVDEGPEKVWIYLDMLEGIRKRALETVSQVAREVRKLNQEMSRDAADTVRTLTVIKTVATITVEVYAGWLVIAAGGPALLTVTGQSVGKVALGYSIAGAVAKNWDDFKMAPSIVFELAKDASAEWAEALSHKALEQRLRHAGFRAEAEEKISEYSASLARKISMSKKAKLGRQIEKQIGKAASSASRESLAKAGQNAARIAGKYLPMVWAAVDVVDDLVDVWDAHKEVQNIDAQLQQ